jgi:hypothetical protein
VAAQLAASQEELSSMSEGLNIIGMIKSRIMRWSGHVITNAGEEKCIWGYCWKGRRKEATRKT